MTKCKFVQNQTHVEMWVRSTKLFELLYVYLRDPEPRSQEEALFGPVKLVDNVTSTFWRL